MLKLNDKPFDLSVPAVMGIINVTPDSFFADSRHKTPAKLLNSVEKIINDGGKIIDLGGYSTRPMAETVSEAEEISRLSFALDIILKEFPDILISVDTFRANTARYAVQNYKIAIINDIGGGTLDDAMFGTIAELGVAYILMHTRGTPATMSQLTNYENVTAEVISFSEKQLHKLCALGVNDVIIDPGFGFAKTLEQNYQLLRELSCFSVLDAPLLAGISRKKMIYNLLETDAQHALNGTTAANVLALLGGAKILRVHDVKEAVEAVRIVETYRPQTPL
jgi:dihydropteroate synthase